MPVLPATAWIVGGAILGALVGSFLATLVRRWPAGRRVTTGRSACEACDTPLGPLELTPILGYLALRGKCRRCEAPIAADHLWVELAAAAIAALAFAILPNPAGLALAAIGWLLLALAWLDARHLWLPPALLALLALATLASGTVVTGVPLQDRLVGGLAGFVILEVIRRSYRALRGHDGMGGGDPLLFGALGLATGWAMLPMILLLAAAGSLAIALASGAARDPTREYPLGTALAAAGHAIICLQAAGTL